MTIETATTSKPAASTRKTRAAKTPAAPTTAVTGTAPATPAAAPPLVVDKPQSVILGPVMRKKELVSTVVERTGMKKKDAKPIVESMLAVMGEALADNRELVLPPFGKLKVRREKDLPNGRMMVVKVRQTTPPQSALPDAAE